MKEIIILTLILTSLGSFAQEAHLEPQLELPRITQRSSRTVLKTKWENIQTLRDGSNNNTNSFLISNPEPRLNENIFCQFSNDKPDWILTRFNCEE